MIRFQSDFYHVDVEFPSDSDEIAFRPTKNVSDVESGEFVGSTTVDYTFYSWKHIVWAPNGGLLKIPAQLNLEIQFQ